MGAPSTNPDGPWIGHTFGGRYRVLRQLGEGGIGCVYVAEHLTLGRNVALKMLHEHFASTPALRQRFEREARALSRLAHPNIVSVVDFGSADETLFLVMELVDGETLSARLRRGALALPEALDVMRQILRALAHAHALGIAHRDLKPGNVLVRRLLEGVDHVTVLDFGLAKFLDEETSAALTRQGSVIGTPAYMAPEQAMGEPATAPADVYAATLILFELVTGRRPFPGKDPGEIFKAHLLMPAPSIASVHPHLGVSEAFEALVQRGLDKTASKRFADARAMLDALEALPELMNRPSLAQPVASAAPAPASGTPAQAARAERPPASFVLASPAEPASVYAADAAAIGTAVTQYALPPRAAVSPAPAADGSRRWVLAAAAFAGFLIILAVAALVVFFVPVGGSDGDPSPDAARRPPPVVITPPSPPAASSRVAARNPWTDSIPAELKSMHDAIEQGVHPSRGALQALYRYGALHRNDPRAHLLLGHTYTNRGWENDAMDAYRDAHTRDPASRGDPRMLADLVAAAGVERYQTRAGGYLVSFFGREALPAVTARIAQTTDPEARARLERLRAQLLSTP